MVGTFQMERPPSRQTLKDRPWVWVKASRRDDQDGQPYLEDLGLCGPMRVISRGKGPVPGSEEGRSLWQRAGRTGEESFRPTDAPWGK